MSAVSGRQERRSPWSDPSTGPRPRCRRPETGWRRSGRGPADIRSGEGTRRRGVSGQAVGCSRPPGSRPGRSSRRRPQPPVDPARPPIVVHRQPLRRRSRARVPRPSRQTALVPLPPGTTPTRSAGAPPRRPRLAPQTRLVRRAPTGGRSPPRPAGPRWPPDQPTPPSQATRPPPSRRSATCGRQSADEVSGRRYRCLPIGGR